MISKITLLFNSTIGSVKYHESFLRIMRKSQAEGIFLVLKTKPFIFHIFDIAEKNG